MTVRLALSTAGLVLLTSCANSSAVPDVRYANTPTVWRVNDRAPIAQPKKQEFYQGRYHFDGYYNKRLDRALQVRGGPRAENINALGEVPDSTWFTNRIGKRAMTPEEVGRGAVFAGSPEPYKPWTVLSAKSQGVSVGFVIRDSRGVKYLLKFDYEGMPETETGAAAITARLLHAAGFNVPEETVVYLTRDDLIVASDAWEENNIGKRRPLTSKSFDRRLVGVGADGHHVIRALVSQFVPGEILGGAIRAGVRSDDPNDRVRHDRRRDLRGAYAIFSWLDHVDIKQDNTIDTYVRDAYDPSVSYVRHYLVDLGQALGGAAMDERLKFVGYAHLWDFGDMFASFITLGTWKRPWEDRTSPSIRGVGMFESQRYHPAKWKPFTPSEFSLADNDRFDNYWGAKIVIAFTPEHIRAAVRAGRFSDPAADEYIIRTLIERQRKTAAYWFSKVNPLEDFRVSAADDGAQLCFSDLMTRHGLSFDASDTRVAADVYDHGGRRLAGGFGTRPDDDGDGCLGGLPSGSDHDGYTIVRLRTLRRGAESVPPVYVHLARKPGTPDLRVIGVWRD